MLPEPSRVAVGALRIDLEAYRVTFAGGAIELSRSQVELLALLVANRRRVVSRDDLARALGLGRGRSIDVMLTGLRRALGRDFVRNVRSRGWILAPETLAD